MDITETGWLPPYLGSWEEIIATLMRNPFAYSGKHPGQSSAVVDLIKIVCLKNQVSKLPESKMQGELLKHLENHIEQFKITHCGPASGNVYGPWHGFKSNSKPEPSPWIFEITASITLAAAIITDEEIRTALNLIAKQILTRILTDRSFVPE